MFPSQLLLAPSDSVDASLLSPQLIDRQDITAAACSRLEEEAAALGGGPRALVREAEQPLLLDLLRRRAGEQWLAHAGLVAALPEQQLCEDAPLAQTLHDRRPLLCPQRVEEEDVLRASRGRVFIPKKKFDASGKIRPTHWGDVGGLEEVRMSK